MLRIPTLLGTLALMLLGVSALRAEDKADAKPEVKKVDAQAERVFRAAATYLQGLKSASSKIKSTLKVEALVGGNEMTSGYTLAVEQPNRLAVVLKEGDMGATVVADGKQLTTYVPRVNRYSVEDSPASLAEITRSPGTMAHMAHSLSFLGFFMLYRTPDELMKDVDGANYLGEEKLDGQVVHHIEISTAQSDWEFWIETGEKPWVWKVEPDIAKALEKTGQELPAGVKFSLVAAFSDWKANPALDDDAFKFTPPESAKKVESLFGPQAHHAPHPLLGKDAPGFELETLAGKNVKLSESTGQKQVVILDFWATWCGPCVQALPTIADVASQYKSKGVTFYAVNLGEDAATVSDFLKEKKLDVPVLLDTESKVGGLYEASAIPQTVLIGKDGVVQVVHVGLSADLRQRLTKELDDLLAGKELAKETLSKAKSAGDDKSDQEKSDDK